MWRRSVRSLGSALIWLAVLRHHGSSRAEEVYRRTTAGVWLASARLHGWASSPYHFWWGVELRYTYRAYEAELEAIGREMPVIITEFHPQYVDDQDHVANWYETAFAHWLADPRVIAATPMFWNPEQDRFWMYAVGGDGSAVAPSPTYARLKEWPKLAGSPQFRSALGNVARPHRSPSGATSADGVPADSTAPVR